MVKDLLCLSSCWLGREKKERGGWGGFGVSVGPLVDAFSHPEHNFV